MLAPFIEPDPAVARNERMPAKDDDRPPFVAGEALQPPEEIDLLGRKELLIESTDLAERRGLQEHERSRRPLADSAERVPDGERDNGARAVEYDRAPACQASPALDLISRIREEFYARSRVRVDEHEPVPVSVRCTRVPRAGDLIERLEDDSRTGRAGDFGGAVGGIVVTDDQLREPSARPERRHRGADALERLRQQPLLVERRDDD